MDFDTLISRLKQTEPTITLLPNEPMSRHTTFRIGGKVRLMVLIRSEQQMKAALSTAHELGIRPFVVGNGSNLLPDDGEMELFAVKTAGGLCDIRLLDEKTVRCSAGVLLSNLAVFAMEHGLTGLEFAHGIPGTFGGGAVMNAGAYGGELKDVVASTRYMTLSGEEGVLEGDAQEFAYRRSAYSAGDKVILSGDLRLSFGDPAVIRSRMEELSRKRRASQPLEHPSGGSTFKRPVGGFAAELIDRCGLKGAQVGGAQVSEKHAGFVINTGEATCRDVLELTRQIRETVLKQTGIELELELRRMS